MEPDTHSGAGRPGRLTEILDEVRREVPGAREALYDAVYQELRRMAASQMRRERPGITLQPTALVHEAYLSVLGAAEVPFEDRAHFFGTAARAMRSILVDAARARNADKRGAGRVRVTFDENRHAEGGDHAREVLAVHEALDALTRSDRALARVVELRYFAGLSVEETAAVLGVTERTVFRQWNLARAWLYREIAG